jgi:hypothetical protein
MTLKSFLKSQTFVPRGQAGMVVAAPSELIHICFQSYFPLSYQYKHAYLWNQSAPWFVSFCMRHFFSRHAWRRQLGKKGSHSLTWFHHCLKTQSCVCSHNLLRLLAFFLSTLMILSTAMPWTVMVGMLMLRFGAVAFARLYFS